MQAEESAPKLWGLFDTGSQKAIPLQSLDISIKIINNVSQVFYTQVYNNASDLLLHTEFFFPIAPSACFDSFEAKFNDVILKGVVKAKEQAQEEYKQAVQKGKTAIISEINETVGDIMKIKIGNIPPKTTLQITYSYLQKLETAMNKFWCFRLFSTITSRYIGNVQDVLKKDISLLSNYPTTSSKAFPWTIQAEIQSPSPLELVRSPSHDVLIELGNENHTCIVKFKPDVTYYPNKDFVLLYRNGKESQTDYFLTPFEDGYCAMLTMFADFGGSSDSEQYENLQKELAKENDYPSDTIRGEYIFLIDRSGSMSGDRIQFAKQSLIVFLKSLPKNSRFNIVSFGSEFSFLHPESVPYTSETVSSTIKKISQFEADMGGTEILPALKQIFKSPIQLNFPRTIFLLTDGDVTNTQEIVKLIQLNNEKARVFTVGIGNGCSAELVTQCAYYGLGHHEFVRGNEDIYEKMIHLLNLSRSPSYSELSLNSNNFDAFVTSVSPNPFSIPYLLNGQTVTFFLFLREASLKENGKMEIVLKLYDSRIKKQREIPIILDVLQSIKNDWIPKLAIHDMIKRLEAQQEFESSEENILWRNKDDIKKTLIGLSVKYGVLCKETAFYCETDNGVSKDLQKCKVIIPALTSADYEDESDASECCWDEEEEDLDLNIEGGTSSYSQDECDNDENYKTQEFKKIRGEAPDSDGLVDECYNEFEEDYSTEKFKKKETSFKKSEAPRNAIVQSKASDDNYVKVIVEQDFEGYWKSHNKVLNKLVFEKETLPPLPVELKKNTAFDEINWMTILILVWLEVRYQNQKKAWVLIHEKGREWLESQGIDYEKVRDLTTAYIKL